MNTGDRFRVLVIDDEEVQREMISGFLKSQGFDALSCHSGQEAVAAVKKERFDLILTDYKMPGMSGLEVLRQVKGINPEVSVVVLTAYGTVETAVAAMKAGAYDYLSKPLDLDELMLLLNRVQERYQLLKENKELKDKLKERYHWGQIVAESGAMQEVLSIVYRVAKSDATVLIRGESGTGKELIAKAIHYNSERHAFPLVTVNCAALPEALLESELFGHEKGAFTGATAQRIGRFQVADRGTIFLDEIGDLTPLLQVKLLRVVQDKEFQRLGSNSTIKVDVRIIAATNCDLEAALKENRFREDLYYRLNVVPIFIRPLRERRQDIPPLIEHFLLKFSQENKKEITGLSAEARDLLMKYDYPGNVRELENIMARAVVLSRGPIITSEDLPLHLRQAPTVEEDMSLPQALAGLERQRLLHALEKNDWIQTRAAQELKISERVLRYKIKKYGLVPQDG